MASAMCYFFSLWIASLCIFHNIQQKKERSDSQHYYLQVLKLECRIPDNWLSLDLSGKVNWKAAFPKFLVLLLIFFFFKQCLGHLCSLPQACRSSTGLCTFAVLLMFGLRGILVNSIYLYDHCFCFKCGI